MVDHFNRLTPAEAERLAWLAEECAEVIVEIGKVLRHGFESYNPTLPRPEQVRNRMALTREIGHVLAAADLMMSHDIDRKIVATVRTDKLYSVRRWMHHQLEADHASD